jgi:hypothetical protein
MAMSIFIYKFIDSKKIYVTFIFENLMIFITTKCEKDFFISFNDH